MQRSLVSSGLILAAALVVVHGAGCQSRGGSVATDKAVDATGIELAAEGAEVVLRPVQYSIKVHSGSSGALLPLNFSTQIAPLFSTLDEWDKVTRVRVVGHTDAEGSSESNQRLSLRRAEAVAEKLADYGVPVDVMTVEGRGEESPIGSNSSISGKQLNRRVEVFVEGLQSLSNPPQVGYRPIK